MRRSCLGPPPAQLSEVLRSVSGSSPVAPSAPEALPATPGAYLLLIRLDRVLCPPVRRLAGLRLEPGSYVYAGSAYGPGGIAARVKRHFRPDKPAHWHIDHLTGAASSLVGFSCPDGLECALLDDLLARGGFAVTAKGFGNSDCKSCESHLLQVVPDLF